MDAADFKGLPMDPAARPTAQQHMQAHLMLDTHSRLSCIAA